MDFSIKNGGSFHSFCKRLPEGNYKWAIYTMAMSNNHRVNQQVTIERVDFPIKTGDFPQLFVSRLPGRVQ